MNVSQGTTARITSVSFSFFSTAQQTQLSAASISNPDIFDALGHPVPDGLCDARLGATRDIDCATCSLGILHCPGHFGHIALALPVFNPIVFAKLYKLLTSCCVYCHHLRVARKVTARFACKLRLVYAGLLQYASHVDAIPDAEYSDYCALLDEYFVKCFAQEGGVPGREFCAKLTLVSDGIKALEKQYLAAMPSLSCQNCTGQSPKFRKQGYKVFEKPLAPAVISRMSAKNITREEFFESTNITSDSYISQLTVMKHMELLWDKERPILDILYGVLKNGRKVSSPDMFFLKVISVPPTKFRPSSKMGEMLFEHPQNINLTEILRSNMTLSNLQKQERDAIEGCQGDSKLIAAKRNDFLKYTLDAWIKLQSNVEFLIDSSAAPAAQGKIAPPGIRQLLEKKEGLFRKHMMGKRVNFACRSVISPDPYIETNEIGIPPVFAKKLTYPESVTQHNFQDMRACVINGPEIWPGATHIQNQDGSLMNLASFDSAGRTALANQLMTPSLTIGQENYSNQFKHTNKKVLRHLRNGDFLLLNRQPTLHKPSIMAHTARVLPGEKTIRMHYANCNTYNADFDGDEMNCHFPQNDIARAEAMLIARNDLQYLVPTDGSVLRGLIQDHVDAGVDMCSRDTFYTREEYFQLVYQGLREPKLASVGNGNIEPEICIGRDGRIVTLPPAIMKPSQLWTGKQIISTVLYNLTPSDRNQLNMVSTSKIPASQWGPSAPEEQTVLVMDGQLIHGILDKSQFGASANGLVHAFHEVYGPTYAGKLLSIFGRLFTAHLQLYGFSCRMDDLLLTPLGNQERQLLINEAQGIGLDSAVEFTKQDGTSELKMKLELESVLRNSEKMAGLDSAYKTRTNRITSQIISTCIPKHLYKPFPYNNMQVMTVSGAKGSSVNVSQISCLLGQQELEGKRVPTMVSGKTLPSFRAFDTSAASGGYITGRFLSGVKPQEYYFHCMAGREGLIDTAVKTSRSGYLQRCLIKHLEGLRVHYDHTVRDIDGSVVQFHYGEDSLDILKQTTLEKFDFNALNYASLLKRYNSSNLFGRVDEDSVRKYLKHAKKRGVLHDPIISNLSPSKNVGAVSESFREKLISYIDKNTSGLLTDVKPGSTKQQVSPPKIYKKFFEGLMHLKYMNALVEPGEAVGLLAAQSIGEPSTQMTLNTFHFAGFGAKNVTLGIPRLREIIMTASANLKTPLMKIRVLDEKSADVDQLTQRISKLVLAQIMTGLTVTESLSKKNGTGDSVSRNKVLTVSLAFWDRKDYEKQYGITRESLGLILESSFIPALDTAILRTIKGSVRKLQEDDGDFVGARGTASSATKSNVADDDDSDSSDIEGDLNEDAKLMSKKTQRATYDDPDDDEKEIIETINVESDDDDSDSERTESPDEANEQETRVIGKSKYATSFKFNGSSCTLDITLPAQTRKILMLALIEGVCAKIVLNQVPLISRCYVLPNEAENDKTLNIGTDGCNLRGMWEFDDILDINSIYTNDICAILRTYGVEAARAAVMQEIASVFAVYGIKVDPRHLSLIADFMTFEGGYKAFNRTGMNSNPSPFAQMSFETTASFLTTATLMGDNDPLDSPSARLVLGQLVSMGTGAFDVVMNVD